MDETKRQKEGDQNRVGKIIPFNGPDSKLFVVVTKGGARIPLCREEIPDEAITSPGDYVLNTRVYKTGKLYQMVFKPLGNAK